MHSAVLLRLLPAMAAKHMQLCGSQKHVPEPNTA
jgi:hypothetical protein